MQNNPTTLRARELRQTANPAEYSLWYALKGKHCGGYKFTRQFPIGPYFADFACRSQFLLVEVDGSQHNDNPYDAERDAYLLTEGYSVLRVPSATIFNDRDAVCETILAALENRLEDRIAAPDLRYTKTDVIPRRFTRHRPWAITHP
jgi:very-short-patch-repair endonuclease